MPSPRERHTAPTESLRVAIVTGSTRPGRHARDVCDWVQALGAGRTDAAFEVLDLEEFALPLLDEPLPPLAGAASQPHTLRWAAAVAGFDGFVFVTPEYNHSISGALKNALDFLYSEWNHKSAGFVSYGVEGGQRAVEHLRTILAELRVADVRAHVTLRFGEDFEGYNRFAPRKGAAAEVEEMLDEVIDWGRALKPLRSAPIASAP